jgi:hypothetical protein
MDGESKTYSWERGYPEFDLADAVIQMTNLKSEYKPYLIFREGGGFEVFNLEVRPEYSHFPWWNHWPVAQTYSDGRSANAPDRAAHSSLSWGNPAGNAAIYGMTNKPAESLVALARSWNYPPEMNASSGVKSGGYDYTQRAYVLKANNNVTKFDLEFAATEESPLANLVIVVNNWGTTNVSMKLNGEDVPRGKDFRYGIEYDVEGNGKLIVFAKVKATKTTAVSISSGTGL